MKPKQSDPQAEPSPPATVRYPLAEVLRHASGEYYQEELYDADLGHVSQEEIDRMVKTRRGKEDGDKA